MNKDRLKHQKGITLIALVVTIVVLLILAAISINVLSGEDGIISEAIKSKEEQEIGKEKELINLAYTGLKSGDINRQITAEDMENEINNINGAGTVDVTGQGTLKIEFLESNRNYLIDVATGKVQENNNQENNNQENNNELEELVGEAYAAVYDKTQLVFGRTEGEIPATYTYTNANGVETTGKLTTSWKGIETKSYSDTNSTPWDRYYGSEITAVDVIDKIRPTNTAYWFDDLAFVTTMNLTNLDTSRVTDMTSMFNWAGYGATSFELIGLDTWDVSNVTSMYQMFKEAGREFATTFNIGDLSNWDVSSVTNMSSMFDYAGHKATTWNIGDLSNWDVSNVTDMSNMFYYAGNKTTTWNIGDLNNWDVSSVTNMDSMFRMAGQNATTWNIGDLSNWDVSGVTNMGSVFRSTGTKATTWNIGDLSDWNVSNVTNMSFMFRSAGGKSTTWSIGNLSNWDVSNVTDMSNMFCYAGNDIITFELDLSNWDVSRVTNMEGMFYYTCQNATTWNIGNLSNWDVRNVENMLEMFCYAGRNATYTLDLTAWSGKVSNVTNHKYFNTNVTTKVIAPTWVN